MELSLYHLVRQPKVQQDKSPLLLLLHGYGSNEEDLFSFAAQLPDEYLIISARAPYAMPGGYGHAWYAIDFDADMNKFTDDVQAVQSRDAIAAFIDEVVDAYPVDKDNITLIGFSQGAILSYAVALTHPEKISRVAALSGYLHNTIIGDINSNDLSKLRFFVSHGVVDQVIPVDWARKAPEFLKTLGLDVEYHEYNVGHGVAPQNFYDLLNWLNK